MRNLGTKLTCFLFVGVLCSIGAELYLSMTRIQVDLLHSVRREVMAVSRTLHLALTIPEQADVSGTRFTTFVARLSQFENMLDVVFYDRTAQIVARSTSLPEHQLPPVNIHHVIATQRAVDGLFSVEGVQRYYHIEPIGIPMQENVAAMLVLEDFPFFTPVLRERMVVALGVALGVLVVLGVIVALIVRRSIAQPLRTLITQVEAIGQGHFPQRFSTTRGDEIGRLAQAFDRMCLRLEAAQQTLETEHAANVQLERALHQSEQLATLGKLASRLAHEIGTPLNVIQGRAEQLLRRDNFPEKDRAFLEVIVSQIDRISGFLTQLLAPARRHAPQFRIVHLEDVIHRVWEVVSDRGTAAHVEVTLDLPESLPVILGDPQQLQQVFLNLSVNALQAVAAPGQVILRARFHPDEPPGAAGHIAVEVADNGPGIAEDDLAHIFEPFFTTKELTGGTGLGLTISREIVHSHGGEMRVQSRHGYGTQFFVLLPVTEQPAGNANTQTAPALEERTERYGEYSASRASPHLDSGR